MHMHSTPIDGGERHELSIQVSPYTVVATAVCYRRVLALFQKGPTRRSASITWAALKISLLRARNTIIILEHSTYQAQPSQHFCPASRRGWAGPYDVPIR